MVERLLSATSIMVGVPLMNRLFVLPAKPVSCSCTAKSTVPLGRLLPVPSRSSQETVRVLGRGVPKFPEAKLGRLVAITLEKSAEFVGQCSENWNAPMLLKLFPNTGTETMVLDQ